MILRKVSIVRKLKCIGGEKMKANIIKRMLCGALALSLVLAPSISTFANGTARGTVAPVAEAAEAAATTGTTTTAAAVTAVKESSTVAGVRSTVGGAFILEKGINVATTTNATDLAASYNLGNGARPFVKAYDMDVKKSSQAKACMDNAAAAYGAAAFGYINFELGAMNGGKYSLLSGGNGVDAAFSIPAKDLQAGAAYGIICVQDGGVITILRDSNPDDNIITVTLPAGRSALALVKF